MAIANSGFNRANVRQAMFSRQDTGQVGEDSGKDINSAIKTANCIHL